MGCRVSFLTTNATDEPDRSSLQCIKLPACFLRHRWSNKGDSSPCRCSSLMAAKGLACSEVCPVFFLSGSEIVCRRIRPSETSGALQNLCSTPKHCSELLRSLRSFRIIFKPSCGIYEKYSSLDRIPLPKYKQSFFQVLELHP